GLQPGWQIAGHRQRDNVARLWKTSDYQLWKTLEGHTSYVNGVAFNPDGSFLVTGSDDKTIGIWGIQNGQQLNLLKGHEDTVLRVVVNPSGTLIASISWDGTVRLWGVVQGE
ncbi:MAG: hypothetical protein MUO77_00320, partial [Anaerolineales bacterium]|nr:hypothetical protein [Anaerolineales bacterium]